MKRKFITIMMAICMTVVYMPSIAFAEGFNTDSDMLNNSEVVEDLDNTTDPESIEDAGYDKETEQTLQRLEELTDSGIDFSSKRLIVKGLKQELKDEPVIASLDGVYLLQYDDYTDAIEAYYKLSKISDSVEFDSSMSIASGVGISAIGEEDIPIMTENENPFTEIDEIKTNNEVYDIAVIDTGANNVDKAISVLGDNGKDRNGHGQKMVDIIKQYAPDAAILSIKAIGDDGVGDVSAVYAAIKLAIDNKVSIINLSISALSTEDNFIIEEIIAEAESKGITVVGAAGNNGIDASLTVPGKIKDAIIVGTTLESSNTGETVDYFVPTSSTSLATATVTGLLISDTLKDYEIINKVIKLNGDNDNSGNTTDPSEDFTTQDDGGGGAGGGGAGTGTGGKWSNTKTNRTFVWYDRGGWVDTDQSGSGRFPVQGYYQKSNGKWYDNHGENPMSTTAGNSSNNWTDGFYTYKFFIRRLTEKVQAKYGSSYHYDFMKHTWLAGQNDKIFKQYMEDACVKALNRSRTAKTARVVGVAVTYRIGDFSVKSSKWNNIWVLMRSKGDKSYVGMFGGSGRLPNTYNSSNAKSELASDYGWNDVVDRTTHNQANPNETWAHYIYRIGKEDNAGYSAQTNTMADRFFVVAVADDEPPSTVNVIIKKKFSNNAVVQNNSLYSLEGVVFKLYKTQADARNNTNAVVSWTTDANGNTTKQAVAPSTYYLVELGPPKNGRIIPEPLKAENGGKQLKIASNVTITVTDSEPTGVYSVTYQYMFEGGGNLPEAVMATIPSTESHQNGSIVTAVDPATTTVVVGEETYVFMGWDQPKKAINDGDVTFVGTWALQDDSEVDDWGDDVGDDAMAINYTYVLENAEEGEVLPDEVWATLPEDLDDEGFPKVYTEGDTAIPDEPSQSQVEVNDVTYVFMGWDKQSDTFTDTSVLFTGTWQKVTT